MAFVTSKKAVAATGLHAATLRKYADAGHIKSFRLPNGDRLFDVESFLAGADGASAVRTVCYCRVSSTKQRDDLARQVLGMRSRYPEAEIIQDIGSGLNFKRKGLQTLLGRLMQGDKFDLVLTHRDRLCRFGFQLFEFLFEKSGGKILVLDQTVSEPKQELVQDLLAILHHFSCRMHGSRSHKSPKNSAVSDTGTEDSVQTVVRDFSQNLQRFSVGSEFDSEAGSLDESVESYPSGSACLG